MKAEDPTAVCEGDTCRALEKPALRRFYDQAYFAFTDCLTRCPKGLRAVELGSGFARLRGGAPHALTSDVVYRKDLDLVLDARRLPFQNETVPGFLMINVLHHVGDVEAVLSETARCLAPGGRLFIVDQHPGWISTPILKYGHHEPFDAKATAWKSQEAGPLSGANGAIAWILFQRDAAAFAQVFPQWQLVEYRTHSPLLYWLSGGLKRWSLAPGWALSMIVRFDHALLRVSRDLGSFVNIELVKVAPVASTA
jgi:SAM-dependent methyltransferase